MADSGKVSKSDIENIKDSSCSGVKKVITVNLGFIGAGNMATAIGKGVLKSGIINASQVYVSAPSNANLIHWKSLGVNTTSSNSEIIINCPIVILAVKPQYAAEAILSAYRRFNECNFESVFLVSILAGISCDCITKMVTDALPDKILANKINVCRAMPNTPVLVGEGCTVVCFKTTDSQNSQLQLLINEYKNFVKSIFSVCGYCEEVGEHLINPIGALSGSGPAYVYQIIEALSDGAVKLGVPRNSSYLFAAQTLLGAAKMVLNTGKHPGQLKDEVCSPGGTTIAGITAMEKNGVRYGLIQAIEAAFLRSEEIARIQSRPK